MNKNLVADHPWALVGDFNVTLNLEEHSNGSSGLNSDMQEFRDLVNPTEVDDLHNTGFYFTCSKSLKNPHNCTLKKLDRILINDCFISQYGRAQGRFLPNVVSDHSPLVSNRCL